LKVFNLVILPEMNLASYFKDKQMTRSQTAVLELPQWLMFIGESAQKPAIIEMNVDFGFFELPQCNSRFVRTAVVSNALPVFFLIMRVIRGSLELFPVANITSHPRVTISHV
jgi:hypothetical protein